MGGQARSEPGRCQQGARAGSGSQCRRLRKETSGGKG